MTALLTRLAARVKRMVSWLRNLRTRINRAMGARYAPWKLALLFAMLTVLFIGLQLFVPPYIGSANDGSFDTVMQDVGLARLTPDDDDAYFNYYEREYRLADYPAHSMTTPLALRASAGLAIAVDRWFTGDERFDMRVLALLYCLLYVPAVFLVTRFAMRRVQTFTEGVLVGVLSLLVFADVSLVSRFPSLYVQPLILISLLYMAGMLILLCESPKAWPMAGLLAALMVLLSADPYAGAAAFVLSIFLLVLLTRRRGMVVRLFCIVGALCIGIMGFAALMSAQKTVTLTQKYNAMARGILLKSSQPEETLAEFGIDPRYSIVTDTYADQNYPLALVDASALQTGFFDHYNTGLILSYYIRHPGSLIGMLDAGVGISAETRPSYNGNYEKSTGKPEMAQARFLALWSSLKSQATPRTVGLLLVLGLAILFVYRGPKNKLEAPGKRTLNPYRAAMLSLLLFELVHMATVIVYSGDAEMMREAFVMSILNDVLFLWVFSEVLHRLNRMGLEEA
ncbi:MAG TPA: hypothetical protein PKU80_01905 [Candidatus Limiplasma sp.]|nr:hypothetical protein [Candidatus Limiplasma sp.]HRX07839.1 hypothetical protein [Candidatus Limiplasma sp.]